MQIVPAISISEGVPTILMPLTVIVVITAIKAFFEDHKRALSDKEENDRDVLRFDTKTRSFALT